MERLNILYENFLAWFFPSDPFPPILSLRSFSSSPFMRSRAGAIAQKSVRILNFLRDNLGDHKTIELGFFGSLGQPFRDADTWA